MATINSKKLLPPSKKSKQVFLVPVSSIVPSTSLVKKLKPAEETKKSDADFTVVKGKLIKLTDLFKNKLLLTKQSNDRKRKEQEREKAEQREKKLEGKDLGKKGKENQLIGKIPGQSIFDRIFRFAGFTLLGFLLNNYANLLPKLLEFGSYLKPAVVGLDYFARGFVDNTIAFIDNGYKAYDTIRGFAKSIGGENFQKLFDDFSGKLNQFLNTALIVGVAGFGGGLLPKRGLKSLLGKTSLSGGTQSGIKGVSAAQEKVRKAIQKQLLEKGKVKSLQKKLREYGKSKASILKDKRSLLQELSNPKTTVKRSVAIKSRLFEISQLESGAAVPIKTKEGTYFSRGIDLPEQAVAEAEQKATRGQRPPMKIKKKIVTSTKPTKPPTPKVPQPKGSFLGKIPKTPFIGAIIDYVINTQLLNEEPSKAAASAIGSGIGGWIGSSLGTLAAGGLGLGTGGVGLLASGAIIGASSILGATLGSLLGTFLYDAVSNVRKTFKFAQGGQIPRGGRRQTAPSRQIRRVAAKPRKVQPQRTQPGRDVGGIKKIEALYGQDKPGQKSGLRALKNTSSYLKGVSVLNGSLGNIMGASVDLAMGQKFDKKTIRAMGDQFGFAIQNMVDNQVSMSLGDISRQLAMANGGVVPSRRIGEGLSVGTRVSMLISNALSSMMENVSGKILQNIMKEIEGKAIPGGGGGGGLGPGAGPMVSSDSADFWLLSLISLYENANPQGAADVAQSIYNRMGYSGRSAREVILSRNQYQPVGQYGSVADWNNVVDKQSALNHIRKFPGNAVSADGLERVAAALLDKSVQQKAAKFVGNRPDFRSDGYEGQYDDMTDDISRYGQTFGFNRGSAYKGKSLVARVVPSLVRGTVTEAPGGGLPLTGDNGRMKPSQLTRVGTLVGGVDYQDWYGNGAYLRNDAAAAFLAAKAQARKEGITIQITSAYRSIEHQRAIQGKYAVVAAPGTSRHGEGTALDIQTGTAGYAWFVQNGPSYGWRYMAIPGDPVHFEYLGGFVPSKMQREIKLSPIFDRTQASIAPSQQTREVASLQMSPSYALIENNTFLYQKEIVLTG